MFHRIVNLRSAFILVASFVAAAGPVRADSWLGAGKATAAAFDLKEEAVSFSDAVEFVPEYNALAYFSEQIAKKCGEIIDKAASPSGYGQAQWKYTELRDVFHELEAAWADVHAAESNASAATAWPPLSASFLKLNYVMEAGKIATAADVLSARSSDLVNACGTGPAQTKLVQQATKLGEQAALLRASIGAGNDYGPASAEFNKVKNAFTSTQAAAAGASGSVKTAWDKVQVAFKGIEKAFQGGGL